MIITKDQLLKEKERFAKEVLRGEVFLHPTDTINGLGVDATNDQAVKKLRQIKHNKDTPMSIIPPSKEWVKQNCLITPHARKWLKKLPGPYTLVLNLKQKGAISKHVNPRDETIGIRIPDHWITKFVEHVGVPIITTTANVHGEEYKEDIEELHPNIANNTKFFIYEVGVGTQPSDVVFLTEMEPKVVTRR